MLYTKLSRSEKNGYFRDKLDKICVFMFEKNLHSQDYNLWKLNLISNDSSQMLPPLTKSNSTRSRSRNRLPMRGNTRTNNLNGWRSQTHGYPFIISVQINCPFLLVSEPDASWMLFEISLSTFANSIKKLRHSILIRTHTVVIYCVYQKSEWCHANLSHLFTLIT
jgi:hypothetical protein